MNKFAFHIVLGTLGSAGLTAQAQVALTGSPYEQSFDTLGLGLPAGWSVRTGASGVALGLSEAFPTTTFNWSGTTAGYHNYASTTGLSPGSTAAAQAAASDRALGVRQSGTFGDPGAALVLEIADTIGAQTLVFSFDFLVLDEEGRSATWTADYALGDHPASFTSLGTFSRDTWGSQLEQFALPAAVNDQSETLWIRLAARQASTGSGSRDTYALDNFRLTYAAVPEPAAWSSLVGAGLLAFGLVRSRRASR